MTVQGLPNRLPIQPTDQDILWELFPSLQVGLLREFGKRWSGMTMDDIEFTLTPLAGILHTRVRCPYGVVVMQNVVDKGIAIMREGEGVNIRAAVNGNVTRDTLVRLLVRCLKADFLSSFPREPKD